MQKNINQKLTTYPEPNCEGIQGKVPLEIFHLFLFSNGSGGENLVKFSFPSERFHSFLFSSGIESVSSKTVL